MANPIEQFQLKPIVPLEVAGVNISFTNSALMMVAAVVVITAFLTLSVRSRALVPGRWQSMAEVFYEFIANMLRDGVGPEGRPYFPFVFTLFMFVMIGNVLGLLPFAYTFTSQVIVTFTLAVTVFIGVTIIGFARHGLGFLGLFFPHGAPIVSAVVLVPIEVISYLSRPISLSVRLFANMTAGHIILTILGGFVVSLGAFFIVPGVIPFAFLGAVAVLEIGIALLQAYVFTALTCIYLHDAIHMH